MITERNGTTNENDLRKICKSLGIPMKHLYIGWSTDPINRFKKYNILNIGKVSGTHWIVVIHDKGKKIYFDATGTPSEDKFKDYERTDLQIQHVNRSYCGEFCCLYIYHYMINEIDKFFSSFQILNI